MATYTTDTHTIQRIVEKACRKVLRELNQQQPKTTQQNAQQGPKQGQTEAQMRKTLRNTTKTIIALGGYQNGVLPIDTIKMEGLPYEFFPDTTSFIFRVDDNVVPFSVNDYMQDQQKLSDAIFDYYLVYKRTTDDVNNMPLATYHAKRPFVPQPEQQNGAHGRSAQE